MTTITITIDVDAYNHWKSFVRGDLRRTFEDSEKYRTSELIHELPYWIKVAEGTKGFLYGLAEKTPEVNNLIRELTFLGMDLRFETSLWESRRKDSENSNKPEPEEKKPGLTFPEPHMDPDGI